MRVAVRVLRVRARRVRSSSFDALRAAVAACSAPWIRSGSPTMSRTVMRGLSDAYGSWKTICISPPQRRAARARLIGRDARAVEDCTEPDVGSMSRSSSAPASTCRSPTRRRGRASRPPSIEKLDAATAWTDADLCAEEARADREVLDEILDRAGSPRARTRVDRSDSSAAACRRLTRVTDGCELDARPISSSAKWHADVVGAPDRAQRRHARSRTRSRPCERAARMERAARRHGRSATAAAPSIGRSRSSSLASSRGSDASRPMRVRVARVVEDRVDVADLDLPAGVHHEHPVGEPATTPRSWVIRIIAALRARPGSLEHLEHLRLDRDVERGRRLVGDQQRRDRWRSPSRSSPAGACRPRTRAGTGRRAAPGSGCRRVEQLDRRALTCSSAPSRWCVHRDRLGDLVADREHRVERRQRVLEDHRDLRRRGSRCSSFFDSSSRSSPWNSASPRDDRPAAAGAARGSPSA